MCVVKETKLKRQSRLSLNGPRGFILLEGLLAVLIFSLGILALVGMQGIAIKQSAEAKYRVDASFLVNKLIAQMWADNSATLATDYGPAGAKFLSWKSELSAALSGLPGATAAITITPIATPQGNQITVTILWRHPQDPSTQMRRYVSVAQIPVNPI